MTVSTIEKRRRRTAPAPAKPTTSSRGWIWAVAQIAILGAEIFAALFLLAQPAFRPRQVEIVGATHLTPAQIIAALALPPDRNIFFLNHGDLLPMLLQLKAGFAPAFKISLMSFQLDRRQVLTAQTDRGWAIIFGQMVTSDDRATLTPKLAALRALGGRIDFPSAQIQYINLENPGAPAVQMRGRK